MLNQIIERFCSSLPFHRAAQALGTHGAEHEGGIRQSGQYTSHLYIYIWAASLQSRKTAFLAEFDIQNIHSLMSGKATKEAKEDAGWRPVASLPPFPLGCPFLPHPTPTGCPSLCSRCCLESLGATFARLLLLPPQHHLCCLLSSPLLKYSHSGAVPAVGRLSCPLLTGRQGGCAGRQRLPPPPHHLEHPPLGTGSRFICSLLGLR